MSKSHEYNSFSYKVIDPIIKKQLDNRSKLNNTVQIAMPFIKATTTVKTSRGLGFTLGVHAIKKDVTYQDIYASNDANGPLVGYTYNGTGNELIYASVDQTTKKILEATSPNIYTSSPFKAIAPPGITQATISVNKAGVISDGELTISIPTLEQFEELNKLFLIPGVGMVLEWGQQFAEYGEFSTGLTNQVLDTHMFPWYKQTELTNLLVRLGRRNVGIDEIYEKYVYPTKGQYMWFFGRVGNFSTKLQSDGSYVSTVKIIGQHEESWAYSTRNTVGKGPDVNDNVCVSQTNSVENYFSNTSSGVNFKSLLDAVIANKSSPWNSHVIVIPHGNESGGEPTSAEGTQNPTANQQKFGDSENAYFISWRFFVNIVLNGDTKELPGIKYMFAEALGRTNTTYINNIKTLRPYKLNGTKVDDEYENYVGSHKLLRSTDPSVLIIVNKDAATEFENRSKKDGITEPFISSDPLIAQFEKLGDFHKSVKNSCTHTTEIEEDRGFLSTGIWLNHKAVVQSMAGGDTLLEGITLLLNRMNLATKGFWQLALDAQDPKSESEDTLDYAVVDINYRPTSEYAVKNFINEVYTFNKFIVRDNDGTLRGSESIECDIDLTLPKLLFSQIATLGIVKAEEIERVNTVKNERGEVVSTGIVQGDNGKEIPPPMIAGPNTGPITKMFGLQVIDPKNPNENPDLTYSLRTIQELNTCNTVNAGLPGNVQGNDQSVTSPTATTTPSTTSTPSQPNPIEDLDFNDAVVNFLREKEGIRLNAYYDPSKEIQDADSRRKPGDPYKFSIGYGHQFIGTDTFIQIGSERVPVGTPPTQTTITADQAERLLKQDIPIYTSEVKSAIGAGAWNRLTVSQKIALTSYTYNVGNISGLVKRGLRTEIERNNIVKAAELIRDGVATAGGIPNTTLKARRQEEAQLFAGGELEIRPFYNLNKIFKYVELYGDYMITKIAGDADDAKSNPFGSAPGPLTIKANLKLPGINGLRVGQLFWIDRIPSVYKLFGAFQILSMTHDIGLDGWKTGITAVYNYLGKNWRRAVTEITKVQTL